MQQFQRQQWQQQQQEEQVGQFQFSQSAKREDMENAKKEAEAFKRLHSPRLANLPREADPESAGFSPRAQFARDDQTEDVGKALLGKMDQDEVVQAFETSLRAIPTLRPLAMPDLRSAELFEAKSLLRGILENMNSADKKLAGSPATGQMGKPMSQGPYRGVAIQINGPLYAAQPNRSHRGGPLHSMPEPETAARHGRSWL